jgi:hypothetical protein
MPSVYNQQSSKLNFIVTCYSALSYNGPNITQVYSINNARYTMFLCSYFLFLFIFSWGSSVPDRPNSNLNVVHGWFGACSPFSVPRCPGSVGPLPVNCLACQAPHLITSHPSPIYRAAELGLGDHMKTAQAMWSPTQHHIIILSHFSL